MTAIHKILSALKNHSADNVSLPLGPTVVDEVLVDEYGSVHWEVTVRRDDGQRAKFVLDAVHDGTTLADATDGQWELSGGAVTSGAVDQAKISVALSGTGASQVLQLVVTVTAGTWFVDVSRGAHIGNPG
jgi:hypothetical protein